MKLLSFSVGFLNRIVRIQTHDVSKTCTVMSSLKNALTNQTNVRQVDRRLFSSSTRHGDEVDEDERKHQEMVSELLSVSITGHHVLVIQPYVKWGDGKRRNTTPELQANEAAALIGSLPKWTVAEKMIVPLRSLQKKSLFGSGTLETLKDKVRHSQQITAVFISVDNLRSHQHKELQAIFRVPVYDRYMIVIQIFRMHAITKEAKLQVAMAEIPFLWSRLKELPADGTSDCNQNSEDRKKFLMQREAKMKRQLLKLRSQREMLRKNRNKFPIVAVVGYTNADPERQKCHFDAYSKSGLLQPLDLNGMLCESVRAVRLGWRGATTPLDLHVISLSFTDTKSIKKFAFAYHQLGKTSLIKALTGDKRMQPRNELFATLDVTAHAGLLPCQLKVIYIDTVGFISDIPTTLIESFVATLEDAILADVILHVRDISHPDTKAQNDDVNETLSRFHLEPSLLKNIIVAGNKVDVYDSKPAEQDDWIPVSAVHHTGIEDLQQSIEKAVLKATGRVSMVIRVPSGGEETRWLYKETAVTDTRADPNDDKYTLMQVVISRAELGRFRHQFVGG